MHEHGAFLTRRDRVEDDRELLVDDLDQLAGILGDVPVLRDDRGHRLAVVPDLLDRDHVLDDRAGTERRKRRCVLGDILPRDDTDDTGKSLRLRRVDRDDLCVGVGASEHGRVKHPGELDVVEITALAAEKARILDPVEALAEPASRHVRPRRLAGDLGGVRVLLGDAHVSAPAAARIDSTMC